MRFLFKPTAAAVLIALGSTIVVGCDGDAAPGVWEHNRLVVRWLLALSVVLLTTTTVFYFVRHRKGLLVVLASAGLVVFHPAWVYRGGGGDCGVSMAEGARNSAILLTLGVAYQLTFWLITRRRALVARRA
jgi:hypothetical protein